MKPLFLIILASLIVIGCRKDHQPANEAPNYIETVRKGLMDSMVLADFKVLDFSKAARSRVDSAGLYYLRVPFTDKNAREDFVFVKTDERGRIERGKIVHIKGTVSEEVTGGMGVKSWNGVISLASLDRKHLFQSPIRNGFVTAWHNQNSFRAETQEPQGEMMPEVIIVYTIPSDGGMSWSSYYMLHCFTSDSYNGSGGGGYYGDFSGGGGDGGGFGGGGGSTDGSSTDPVILVDVEMQDEFEPIDLEKFVKCFAAIPDAGATCSIEIFADIPVDSDPNKIFNYTSRSPGHTFLNIRKSNGTQSVSQNIGFYPKAGWKSILTSAPIDGKFVNNSQHEFNCGFKINITPAQLQAAIMEMLRTRSNKYDIDNYNCTDWAMDVFNAAGGNFQIPLYDIPGNTMSLGTRTPNGIYNKLQEMKRQNDPRAAGITIGIAKGYAGNSTGPCN